MDITIEKANYKNFLKFKKNNKCIIFNNLNYYNSFLLGNIDCIFLDENNVVLLKYLNMPSFKTIKCDYPKEKTSVLIMPQNTSFGIKIGDTLSFESEHII